MQDTQPPADNSDFNRLWWHSRR
ncbi:MAG: hypothetical protein V7713_08195, partial [Marinobacter sp.]